MNVLFCIVFDYHSRSARMKRRMKSIDSTSLYAMKPAIYEKLIVSLMLDLFPHLVVGGQVDVIYTYFKTAFDCLSHTLLFAKLGRMGSGGPLLLWFCYTQGKGWGGFSPIRSSASLGFPFMFPFSSFVNPFLGQLTQLYSPWGKQFRTNVCMYVCNS